MAVGSLMERAKWTAAALNASTASLPSSDAVRAAVVPPSVAQRAEAAHQAALARIRSASAARSAPPLSEAQEKARAVRQASDAFHGSLREHELLPPPSRPPKPLRSPTQDRSPRSTPRAWNSSASSSSSMAGEASLAVTHQVLTRFRALLQHKAGTLVQAWRRLLDPDGLHQLSLQQLAQKCRELGFTENLRALWHALDKDGRGHVTLGDLDSKALQQLLQFHQALAAKLPAAAQTGSPLTRARSILRVLDVHGTKRLSKREFGCVVALLKLAPEAETAELFQHLSNAPRGTFDMSVAVITEDDLAWLVHLALSHGVLPPDEHTEKPSSELTSLRRVWSASPAVFQRLHESARAPEDTTAELAEPRLSVASPSVFNFLYEDAQRREAAKRALEEPERAPPLRAVDSKALERLAKPKVQEDSQSPTTDATHRAINWARLDQLITEKAHWLEQREKRREERSGREERQLQEATQQQKGRATRHLHHLAALRRWRGLVLQVQALAAFAPREGGCLVPEAPGAGWWQMLTLAADGLCAGTPDASPERGVDNDSPVQPGKQRRTSPRRPMKERLEYLAQLKEACQSRGLEADSFLEEALPMQRRDLLSASFTDGGMVTLLKASRRHATAASEKAASRSSSHTPPPSLFRQVKQLPFEQSQRPPIPYPSMASIAAAAGTSGSLRWGGGPPPTMPAKQERKSAPWEIPEPPPRTAVARARACSGPRSLAKPLRHDAPVQDQLGHSRPTRPACDPPVPCASGEPITRKSPFRRMPPRPHSASAS